MTNPGPNHSPDTLRPPGPAGVTASFTEAAAHAAQLADLDDVRLAEAFEVAAARFRSAGLFLSLHDDAGHCVLHDDCFGPSADRARLTTALRDLTSPSPAITHATDSNALTATAFAPLSPTRILAAASLNLPHTVVDTLAAAARGTVLDQLGAVSQKHDLSGITAQLADTYEELSLLYQVSGSMRVNRSPDEYFRAVCAEVATVLGARVVCAVIRPGRNGANALVVFGPLDIDPARLSRFVDEATELLVDRTFADGSREPLVINDVAADENLGFLAPEFKSLIATPLLRDDKVMGFMFAADKSYAASTVAPPSDPAPPSAAFNSVDAKLLCSVASTSAVYIENALLFDDMHGLMMGLLHSLTAAVDAKDSYTCGHSERVALLSRMLAVEAGLSPAEADRVYISGLLHDVGKIGVPEAVLQKTGKLTPDEFELIKMHPQIGARILEGVPHIADVLPGVLYHHERYDGAGYPQGLVGADIPLLGRILCIADSFDAMTSNRTYRRGMPIQQALDEIGRCVGRQFDPDLAHLFIALGADRIDAALEGHRLRNRSLLSFAPLSLPLRAARAA